MVSRCLLTCGNNVETHEERNVRYTSGKETENALDTPPSSDLGGPARRRGGAVCRRHVGQELSHEDATVLPWRCVACRATAFKFQMLSDRIPSLCSTHMDL